MNYIVTDALTSVANINHFLTEYSAIYPITPSSAMGEIYSNKCEKENINIFNNIPSVDVMQSEMGAISSCFGALNSGLYSTTFTSSQGLLLMIPNLYKMASSLKPFVLNVASRSLSTHALNIFCDHSDIYSVLKTGFIVMCSKNVQQAQDFSLISHMITLKSKIPVLHFFDGFITSHKYDSIIELTKNEIISLFPFKEFNEYKQTALTNINPVVLGTNQNPDTYFANREAISEYYNKLPQIFEECFNSFNLVTGRKYNVFDYFGNKNASNVIVTMGSSANVCIQALNKLNEDYGVISVNVLNPFNKEEFIKTLPKTCKTITVLDRTKEAGSQNETLSLNVKASLKNKNIKVLSGRYGLGGNEFNLNCAISCFENMQSNFKDNFTVNINDDILNTNLNINNKNYEDNIYKIVQFGIGSDGSVSAGKNSLKILGKCNFVSGNFYYDSKKSGNITETQIFVSNEKIEIDYKEKLFDMVIVNNLDLLFKNNLTKYLKTNATLLINTNLNLEESLPNNIKGEIANKNVKLFVIDANKIAKENNLNNKINLIMQVALFSLTSFIDENIALNDIKQISNLQYGVNTDYLNNVKNEINRFYYGNDWKNFKTNNIEEKEIKVSNFKANGEIVLENKIYYNNYSTNKAEWLPEKCIACTSCETVCPHSAIIIKKVKEELLKDAPKNFKYIKNKNNECFCLFIDSIKCTGCSQCIKICPTNALKINELANTDKNLRDYFYNLPKLNTEEISLKNLPYLNNYYNNCTACNGCSEIAYYRLLGKLYGNSLVLSNATGCSSIYNGDITCSPFKKDEKNLGTSFVSNLFEDNAEFGYGVTTGYNKTRENFFNGNYNFSEKFNKEFNVIKNNLENANICKNAYLNLQNLKPENNSDELLKNCKFIMPLTHFIVGGDGWAYDIDFSGIDHIVASNKNVNILILDNELYSNTGGQTSKASGYGVKTKYTNHKNTRKKDLFLSLMQYDNLYFTKVCLSANKNHCVKNIMDAVNHNGPSVIVAYTPCINHKINMQDSVIHQQNAVKSGYFNLITFKDKVLTLDSTPKFEFLDDFLKSEGRYNNLTDEDIKEIIKQKQTEYEFYVKLSNLFK